MGSYYRADVITANDYYPFGMQMPGRKYGVVNTNYRYGFNGKENDNDVKGEGNSQNYGMRIYDPRLGRFLSTDPIAKKYPELTPYQFASNSPIENIDIDGLEKYTIHYKMEDGKDIITRVETDNSIKYFSISVNNIPIMPKVVQFIKENTNGEVLSESHEIPLKNYGSTLYVGPWILNTKVE